MHTHTQTLALCNPEPLLHSPLPHSTQSPQTTNRNPLLPIVQTFTHIPHAAPGVVEGAWALRACDRGAREQSDKANEARHARREGRGDSAKAIRHAAPRHEGASVGPSPNRKFVS